MLTNGYFRIDRAWMDSPDFKPQPFTQREAWLWSMERAAFVAHDRSFNGQRFRIERGEFVTSYADMASKFGWSLKVVRTFVERMVKYGRWAKRGAFESPTAPTIIIIRDYDEMQFPVEEQEAASGRAKGKVRAKQGQTKGREYKEGKITEMKGKESASNDNRQVLTKEMEEAVIDRWNATASACGWPLIASVTDVQRRKIGQFVATFGFACWDEAVMRAGHSELLGGGEQQTWFNFDFLLDPEKFRRLMNGDYDKRSTKRMRSVDAAVPSHFE